MVLLIVKLKIGDVVEIIINFNLFGLSCDWIKIVKINKVCNKIC